MSFIAVTKEEAEGRGWSELDVVFVSGDAYIDHPAFGVPLLARLLEANGFRVGIIAQPDWRSKEPFMALGKPRLFFAVSAGAMDSMVAHYTPARKLRSDDAYTPGNRHGARPDRAVIVYTSRIREAYKGVHVVIGGIEASLRRFAHYDFWEDKIRRSILFDSKADLLIYGMAESALLELAGRTRKGEHFSEIKNIKGTAYIHPVRRDVSTGTGQAVVEIPSYESIIADPLRFAEAFRLSSREMNPFCTSAIIQRHGERFLVCNPPALPLSESQLDAIYALPFEKAPHPSYNEGIPAYEQIKTSITTHRGCFGGCAFCAISQHQGKIIQSRSESSIIHEIGRLAAMPWFKGSISDVGGPTANMYGMSCGKSPEFNICRRESCLHPQICRHLNFAGGRAASLLRKIRAIKGVRHVAVSSGVRYDLPDKQKDYFDELLAHHVGGLLKVAPEHLVDKVSSIMRKPKLKIFEKFLSFFKQESRRLGKRQFIVPYLISGHPGCSLSDMADQAVIMKRMGLKAEQVQDFTPTPGTLATCMYYTGIDPFTGQIIHVPRGEKEKRQQKALLLYHLPEQRKHILQALKSCNREDVADVLFRTAGVRSKRPARFIKG
jgi:uncharacterized radical SAM protein YgiQ